MTWLKLIFKYLPELIELLRSLAQKTAAGIEEAQIRRDLKRISKAFKNKDRQQAARDLDRIFDDRIDKKIQ